MGKVCWQWMWSIVLANYSPLLVSIRVWNVLFPGQCGVVEGLWHCHAVLLHLLQDSAWGWCASWCHKLCASGWSCFRQCYLQLTFAGRHQLHWICQVSSCILHAEFEFVHWVCSYPRTFHHLWSEVGQRIASYKSFPRLIGGMVTSLHQQVIPTAFCWNWLYRVWKAWSTSTVPWHVYF